MTSREKHCLIWLAWLVWFALVIGVILFFSYQAASGATPIRPPKPKIPRKPPADLSQGAGARLLLSVTQSVILPPSVVIVPWRYPTNVVKSNYWWNLLSSTDMVHWTVIRTDVTDPLYVTNNRTERVRFFRLKGTTDHE